MSPLSRAKHCLSSRGGFEIAFAALALGALLPLWLITLPPLQDWPQHVAAVRVLNDWQDPSLGLVDAVEIAFGRTQYLAVYGLSCALALVVGPFIACKLVLSLAILATPYALLGLLKGLGGDRRHALWCVPLTYNAHVLLGFFNFVAAIPLALLALTLALRHRAQPSLARGSLLAALLVLLFYTHVVLFLLGALGSALLLVGRPSFPRTLALFAPFVPPAVALAIWLPNSPAGSSALGAAQGALHGESLGATRFDPFEKTLHELPEWVTDVLPGELDLALLIAWCALLLGAALFARAPGGACSGLSLRAGLLSPFSAVAAFVMPYQHEWIWPIAGRFPYLACLFAPLLLPAMRARAGALVAAAVALLSLLHVGQNAVAFVSYERHEARDGEAMLARIPTGARVVGLIYNVNSEYVGQRPFMHFVAYSQAAHGGVVAFSFAEAPSSPFRYTASVPKIQLGFGWAPHHASPYQLASYFDYALVRGAHPYHLPALTQYYEAVAQAGDWSLYRNYNPRAHP